MLATSPAFACFKRVARTSRKSFGLTALNNADRSCATRFANGLPLAHLFPAANLPFAPLPLDAVGDGESLILELFAEHPDLTLGAPDFVPPPGEIA